MSDAAQSKAAMTMRQIREGLGHVKPGEPEVIVQPITYAVSCLPDSSEAHLWTIEVAYRGNDLWAALRHGWCLDAAGRWDYEPLPSSRTPEWLAEHRFPLEEALRLAKVAAPLLEVNGITVADRAAREALRPPECPAITVPAPTPARTPGDALGGRQRPLEGHAAAGAAPETDDGPGEAPEGRGGTR